MELRDLETIGELNRKIEEFETYALINSGELDVSYTYVTRGTNKTLIAYNIYYKLQTRDNAYYWMSKLQLYLFIYLNVWIRYCRWINDILDN